MEDLLDLLTYCEPLLDMKNLDLIQFFLNCGLKDSWITERAIDLACEKANKDDSVYWMVKT